MTRILIPAFLLLIGAVSLLATDTPRPLSGQDAQVKARFEKADKNRDDKLTRGEAKEGMPRVHAKFDAIDKERKGYVTLEQILMALRESK